jgi:hypothetical protein
MIKSFYVYTILLLFWNNLVADSILNLTSVELTFKVNESYQVPTTDTIVKFIEARTKRTVSGDSALSVTLEVKNNIKSETLHLTRTNNTPEVSWDNITIKLLNGDNGFVTLLISLKTTK